MPKDDLASLLKAFEAIPKAARRSIKPALDKGAVEMVDRMRYLAPVKTGKLKRSIQYRDLNDLALRVEAGGEATTVPARNGHGEFDYSLAAEYGTAETQAQPFFWPGFNTAKKRARRRVDRAVGNAVKEAFK